MITMMKIDFSCIVYIYQWINYTNKYLLIRKLRNDYDDEDRFFLYIVYLPMDKLYEQIPANFESCEMNIRKKKKRYIGNWYLLL